MQSICSQRRLRGVPVAVRVATATPSAQAPLGPFTWHTQANWHRARGALAFALALSCAAGVSADALSESQLPWIVRGGVHDSRRVGNTVYLAGDFRTVAPRANLVGAFTELTLSSATPRAPLPRVRGTVLAIADDGSGGWFLGGVGLIAADKPATALLHVRADGSFDDTFAPAMPGTVYALARAANLLLVGGNFTFAGRTHLAAFETTGALLPFDPDPNGPVRAIALSPTRAYIAGDFSSVGGQGRTVSAAFALPGLALTAWKPLLLLPSDARANALAVSASRVYIGGTKLAGNFGAVIALSVTDATFQSAFAPAVGGTVHALALSGNRLFVGGSLGSVDFVKRNSLAAVDIATGALQEWNVDLEVSPTSGFANEIHALAAVGSTLYVAGRFDRIAGTPRANLAAITASDDGRVSSWNPGLDAGVRALAIGPSGGIAVGGEFAYFGAHVRTGIAAIDLVTGGLLPLAVAVDGAVSAIDVSGPTVYFGGRFSRVNGIARTRLAAVDAATADLRRWAPIIQQTPIITSIVAAGPNIFAGGSFTAINLVNVSGFAVLDAVTAAIRSGSPTLNAGGFVFDMELAGSTLFLAGHFSSVGGAPRQNLAALDVNSLMPTSFSPAPDDDVFGVSAAGGVLYVGGAFDSVGGVPRARAAAFNVSTGTLTSWAPAIDGMVLGVSASEAGAYLAGSFEAVNGSPRSSLAAVDTAHGAITLPWDPGTLNPYDGGAAPRFESADAGTHVQAFADVVVAATNEGAGIFAELQMAGAPGPPPAPVAVVFGTSVHLAWSQPLLGGRPDGYILEAGAGPSLANLARIPVDSATPTLSVAGVPPGLYYLRVRARNAQGLSHPSPEIAIAVGASGCTSAPGAVAGLTASVTGATVHLTWPSATGNVPSFALRVGTVPGAANVATVDLGGGPSFTATAVPGAYFARAVAGSPCGIGPPSNETLIPVGGVSPPPAPLAFASVSGGTVFVSWTGAAGAHSYRVEAGSAPLFANLAVVNTSSTGLTVPGVPSGTYYVRVYSVGAFGMSLASNELVVIVP